MLKDGLKLIAFALTLVILLTCSVPASTLSFSTEDGALVVHSEVKDLGRFPNVIVNNAAMSSTVERSVSGNSIIKIATDGSRDKYIITVPLFERDGVAYTNCAYKSVFDSNDGDRFVGVSCDLVKLSNFDPATAVSKQHLFHYQADLSWLRKTTLSGCYNPRGIEYSSYHVVLCTKKEYPDASNETTIVFNADGTKLFSITGFSFVPGGKRDGEFALIGGAGDRTIFYTGNLDCMLPQKGVAEVPRNAAMIGKYIIKHSVATLGGCVYGNYMYGDKKTSIDLVGVSSEGSIRLVEFKSDRSVSGLFFLDDDVTNFNGYWSSVPFDKILPVH